MSHTAPEPISILKPSPMKNASLAVTEAHSPWMNNTMIEIPLCDL
jgi:hypothetical protein